ncbi:hypothetical protein [Microbacterium sp.]|uniref:hypothetical protein n=1 Tax=Microbacterium sp. TaxID=51671 RepID=UPI0028115E25|nr:hypothetical protein [Microbacterium sp.]
MAAQTLETTAGETRVAGLLERIGGVRPLHAERARAELDISLGGLRRSATGALAWESSCLTPDRHPVEFAVTSATDEVRTVVDVVPPEADRRGAVDEAVRIAALFGSTGLPAGVAELLHRHQRGFTPRFGAWLGSRHTAAATRHKLYVEVDPAAERGARLAAAVAPQAWHVLAGTGPVRLIGLALDGSDAVELYVRPPYTDTALLQTLAGRAGLTRLASALAAATVGTDDAAAGRNHAVSVATAGPSVVAVAAFTFAHQRFRRDHRVRDAVLARARVERWPSAELYAAASLPLAHPAPLRRPLHTALSEVALAGAPTIVHHVGMAPPPESRRGPASATTDRGEGR